MWEEERAVLRAMPLPFNGYAEKNCRVSATCLVSFDHNRYSVECRHVGQVVTVRAYAERIVVLYAGELIGEHARCFGQGRTQLLQAEAADRLARSYEYQLRLARFPMPRDLDSFDFRESPVNETQLRQLYTGEYLTGARNIVFVGGTGTGKTHLATALARHAILQGKRARFFSVVDLVNQLARPKSARAAPDAWLHDCSTRTALCSMN